MKIKKGVFTKSIVLSLAKASASVRLSVVLLLLLTPLAGAADKQVLRGHVPAAVTALAPVERLPASKHLPLAIKLPLRNPTVLKQLLGEIYDATGPNYQQYLTPVQFAERFGPTEQDYEAVIAFAKTNGLKVIGTHPNRAVLDVEGAVADIEKAFHINLRVYQHPKETRTFYAPDVEPSLDLAAPVLHVSGLDNYIVPRPMASKQRL